MAVEQTTKTYVLSDYVTVEQSLFDPELSRFQNLYFQSEIEAGPEFWNLLARFEKAAELPDDELLREAIDNQILIPAEEPQPLSPLLEEMEDALNGFMREKLKTDQAGVDRVVPPPPAGDIEAHRDCLRRKLEMVCQVWVGYLARLRRKLTKTQPEEGLQVPTLAEGAEGAWLYDEPELFVVGMFDHLCMLVDAIMANEPEGLSPAYLKATLERPPQKEHLHQQPCTPKTALRRVQRVADTCPAGAKVLLLGDDDLISVAFEHYGGFDVTVMELDQDLVAFLKKQAPSARILSKDLSEGLDEEFLGQFDVVITDPPYNKDGMRFFLRCARPALKPAPTSRLFLNTCLTLVEDAEDIHEFADSLGLERLDFVPGFNQYPLPEHIRLWGMSFLESLHLPPRLGGTLLDQPFLWADLLEYVPKRAPDTKLHHRMELIESRDTPYQQIRLYKKNGHVCLVHNEGIQIHSGDARANHEVMVSLPLALTEQARQVLILGGGDGLAAQEALRFEGVERVVVVDLDGEMLSLAREQADMVALTGGSLNDERVEVVEGDAFAWLASNSTKFDLIVNDLDYLRTDQSEEKPATKLIDFLKEQLGHLSEGGAISYYLPIDSDAAEFYQCELEQLPSQAVSLVSELFGSVVRTPLHTPYVGEHLYLCGCNKAPQINRELPGGLVQLSNEMLELSLTRSRELPARAPARQELNDWEVAFSEVEVEVLRQQERCALFIQGMPAWTTPTHLPIHRLAVGVPAGLSAELGSALLLGCGDGVAVREALTQGLGAVTVIEENRSLAAAGDSLKELHGDALADSRVTRVSEDPRPWLTNCQDSFDLIVVRAEPFVEDIAGLVASCVERLSEGGVLCVYANANLCPGLRSQIGLDSLPGWLRMRFSDETGSFRYFYGSKKPFAVHRKPVEGPYLKEWLLEEMLNC